LELSSGTVLGENPERANYTGQRVFPERTHTPGADYIDALNDPAISIIIAYELIVGAMDKHDIALIDSMISTFPVIHLDPEIGQRAHELLKAYGKSNGLRTFDSLIAATAMEHDGTLVSSNRKHFAMSHGLRLEVPTY
jgi:predicted nucleic acid-binding protein